MAPPRVVLQFSGMGIHRRLCAVRTGRGAYALADTATAAPEPVKRGR